MIEPSEQLQKLSWEDQDALRFAHNIARGLRVKADPGQVKGYALNILENFLEPHFGLEERSLIGRLDPLERLHDSVQEVMLHHAEFADLRRKLVQAEREMLLGLLQRFHQLLEHHVHFEESHFFPYIKSCLDEQELLQAQQEIDGAQIVDCRSWPDPYWRPA